MKDYFRLQWRRLFRILKETGVNPYLALMIAMALFVLGSISILAKAPYSEVVYALLGLGSSNILAGTKRNQFLQQCFTGHKYRQLRLVENLIWAVPFAIMLLFHQAFLTAGLVVLGTVVFSRLQLTLPNALALPTPFSRRPYEFAIGFRKTFWVFPLAFALVYFSYDSGNYNLGVFALAVVLLLPIGYYSVPEPKLYVWTHQMEPGKFLNHKLRIGLLFALSISLLPTIALSIAFPQYAWLTLVFQALGLFYVALGILGKYAYYPSSVNIMPMLALAGCLIFPPALLVVLPSFYAHALRKLKPLLS